ncbi:hypothetical protein DL93DRAFT_2084564 [Clavulina sp. PMI_390]|nr:hypothetical protein DL93DRAFT_2084564 [Clavulina sp. PMI_390]
MQLPFEILGSVFELACQPSRYNSHSTTIVSGCRWTRLAIGSSCSHFRRVLLGTPAAWAYISVYMASDEATRPLHSAAAVRFRTANRTQTEPLGPNRNRTLE